MSLRDIHPSRDRVAEDLPQHPAIQVPQILRPRPLHLVTPRPLAVDCLDQPVQSTQYTRPLRLRITLFVLIRR